MLELDLILNKFFEHRMMNLSQDNKKLFLELLDLDDKDIWRILYSGFDTKYDSLTSLIHQDNYKEFESEK
jgi:succinate dehydrogenase flavin-adding protein (antitoxin of CptAB toxin-antitoxin module)